MEIKKIINEIKKCDNQLAIEFEKILLNIQELKVDVTAELAGSRSRGIYFDIGNYRKYKSDFDIYIVFKCDSINFDDVEVELSKKIEKIRSIIEINSSNYKHYPGMSKIRTITLGIDIPIVLEVKNDRFIFNNLTGEIQKSNAEFLELQVKSFLEQNRQRVDVFRIIRTFRALLRINERKYPKGIVLDLIIINNYVEKETVFETLCSTLQKTIDFLNAMEVFELISFGESVVLNYDKENFKDFSIKIKTFLELMENN